MKLTIIATIAISISFGAAAAETAKAGAKIYGNPQDGRIVVERWCAGCHSMGVIADDRFPSFPMLARNMARSEGAIRAFLMQPHKPMPPVELSIQQIEDIIAFLRTVQPGTALK
jgi:mono/diheme cytochrome c family protein